MVSLDSKFIFLLPPKTGSTSFTQCLKNSEIRFSKPQKNPEYPEYHLTLSELLDLYNIKIEELSDYKIIQIIRNPYDRFISSYFHQIEIHNKYNSIDELLNNLLIYKSLLPNKLNQFYMKFYGTIQYKFHSFSNKNWGGARFWFEQNWWNDVDANVTYFKLEEISKDISQLSNFINFKLNQLDNLKPNLSKREIDYKIYYNSEIFEKVKKLYVNDVKLFDYEF